MAKTNIDIKNITKENLKILIDKKSIENRVASIANQINKI